MKTLVMTTIFVMTAVVNAFSANIQQKFAYNTITNDTQQVETQMVYKVEEGKYLHNHLKYNFKYDANNRILQKEVLKWNEIEQAFERYYCLNYNYSQAGVDLEYALWDNKTGAYSDVKEKAVYLLEGENVNYLSYKWNEAKGDWNLLVENSSADEEVRLLAGK